MKILFKFASRSRPQKFLSCIKNIQENIHSDNYHILGTFDLDDLTMNNETVISKLKEIKNFTYIFGHSKNKINAINRDMDLINEWDILICFSDDMLFVCKNFDEMIRNDFKNYFPELDGVLHYNDSKQGANCMTMSIMGRKYYELDNFIYDPNFESLWCDVVAQEVAMKRNKYKYMGDEVVLFNHLHPSWGLCEYDEQYQKTESFPVRSKDYNTYLELKKEYDPENEFAIRSI